ncbi:hypothetical protein [Chitinophaga agri]|uniref:Uncharacterized protein n=1 Tax=Chitinophaga agri TaxID=2703787 RepID=A0A6B9ZJG7_9BACT|nr:hypothetical protein [Chitinophaga agri]QHS60753.1 hypothetical protein GWR21_14465 [Chitinophaga agri]
MEEFYDVASEKYKKYLLQVVYNDETYYTVSGSEGSEDETLRLLTDGAGNICLYPDLPSLRKGIAEGVITFDTANLQAWGKDINETDTAYTGVDFSSLMSEQLEADDDPLLYEIYGALGIVTDYAEQQQDAALLSLLDTPIVKEYMDICADLFLWSSDTDSFREDFDFGTFVPVLGQIYTLLTPRLRVV